MVTLPEKQSAQLPSYVSKLDKKVVTAFACIILLLLCGSLYSPNFLSPEYLLQQLKVASFLGIIATGMMLVILLGHIDLSVPWVVTSGAMMACAAAAMGPWGSAMAIPIGMVCGAMIGFINGWATGYLRIPSMIVTLATNSVAQGLMVVYTGGYAPQDSATPGMRYIATGEFIPHLPNSVILWVIVGAFALFILTRTTFGRQIYAVGNRERAAYLSGINTRRVILLAFVLSGALSALGGVMLAGYAAKAAQSMGDAYLLPAIAAVVLGGTHVLGGRGSYAGTIAGVLLITLLQSILSVMQIPEAGRQFIFGLVILSMLLVYGRQVNA